MKKRFAESSRLVFVVRLVAALFCLMALHRLLIANAIGMSELHLVGLKFKAALVGLGSDLWIAALLGILCAALSRRLAAGLLLFTGILLAAHIPYTQFFNTTLRWIHLRYLCDREFLASSAGDALQFSVLVQVCAALVCAWWVQKKPVRALRENRTSLIGGVLLCLGVGLSANFFSQKYTRRWDFSPNLTQNVLAGLALDGVRHFQTEKALAFSVEDNQLLAQLTGNSTSTPHSFWDLLKAPVVSQQIAATPMLLSAAEKTKNQPTPWLAAVASEARSAFAPEQLRHEKRYFIVVLMESARALESHLYYPDLTGHMPNLDALVAQGVVFERGVSTGTVSRAGSEAVGCNSFPSVLFNAMRETPYALPRCAREFFAAALQKQGISSSFTFMAGGFLSFDGQGAFWKKQGFSVPVDPAAHPEKAMTSWGLSDRALFSLAVPQLESSQNGLHFSIVATVTNHTAYALPRDADPDLVAFQQQNPIKMHGTARYADRALGEFVTDLKKKHIWENAVVVFVGDHGTRGESELYPGWHNFGADPATNLVTARSLTGIYFGLGGGIIEHAVADCRTQKLCPGETLRAPLPVSQADILPTLADLTGLAQENTFVGTSVFSGVRRWPVFADTGEGLYFPGLGSEEKYYSREDFFSKWTQLDARSRLARVWYKSYLDAVRQGKLTPLMP